LLMAVGIALSTGISSRRTLLGCLVTFTYAGALLVASVVHDRGWEVIGIDDAVGIILTGCVISLVGSKLGRTLDEARRQRDGAREQKDRTESVLQQLTERSRELTTAIGSLHDEMERRMRVEVELRQAQTLDSVGRLAAGVAHEINTPVQFVSDSIQFVRDGVAELFGVVDKLEVVQRSVLEGAPSRAAAAMAADATDIADLPYLAENVPTALERALEGLGRVATIVRSMKEFAHPDSRDMELADLNHAIENTLTMARNEYKGVAELETDFGELPPVRCHIGELNQAVLNIVINAAHAISDVVRGTEARGRIRVRTRRDGDDVVVAIADSGAGIPEDIRGQIFDPFFTTKQVGRGTGQGLAIAHSVIVDKHHGRIAVETELGKGTTFSIRLPIDGCQSAPSSDAA
ncbi:MAG TPA: ATP-binding protein, partial [Kofleriaceae bacterium]